MSLPDCPPPFYKPPFLFPPSGPVTGFLNGRHPTHISKSAIAALRLPLTPHLGKS